MWFCFHMAQSWGFRCEEDGGGCGCCYLKCLRKTLSVAYKGKTSKSIGVKKDREYTKTQKNSTVPKDDQLTIKTQPTHMSPGATKPGKEWISKKTSDGSSWRGNPIEHIITIKDWYCGNPPYSEDSEKRRMISDDLCRL